MKENLEECDSEIRLCVADCKSIIQGIDNIIIQYASRSKNKVTHLVAKSSLGNKGDCLSRGIIPKEIQEAIVVEENLCKVKS